MNVSYVASSVLLESSVLWGLTPCSPLTGFSEEYTVCPQSPFVVLKIVARKQIELATCGLRQIIVKLWKFFTDVSRH
jgi:hypothetical protein